MLAAGTVTNLLKEYPAPIAAALIVLIGLALGWRDLFRFSPRRVGAVASVCFKQSIRRRVLWITPLIIVGIIIVSQFQKSIDAQDAIRQVSSYCLFATGMVVALVSIILACTNLPRDIETRVIYTVATKPVTRLEIILGKVAGFMGVTFCMLAIMGVFTFAYLHLQDWRLRSGIRAQLAASDPVDRLSRPTLEYYRDHGTLHARVMGLPDRMLLLAHEPKNAADYWIPGGDEHQIQVMFQIDRSKLPEAQGRGAPEGMVPGVHRRPLPGDLELLVGVQIQKSAAKPRPVRPVAGTTTRPTTQPTTAPTTQPQNLDGILIELQDTWRELVVPADKLAPPLEVKEEGHTGKLRTFALYIRPEHLDRWVREEAPPDLPVFVSIRGLDESCEYTTDLKHVQMRIVGTKDAHGQPERFAPKALIFGGRQGQYGLQLRGQREEGGRVAVFEFRNQDLGPGRDRYPFELRLGIEPDRSDEDVEEASVIELAFKNIKTGKEVRGIKLTPETNRPIYLDAPAEAVEGGNFDVILRMRSPGWVGVRRDDPQRFGLRGEQTSSIKLVMADQNFGWNLFKSLGILWMMSLLVIVVSIFCSTFLSWPIAVVATVVILFGHWGAQQLGDMTQPGLGRTFVNDLMPGSDAATARAVSGSAEALVSMLNVVSTVLPDISRFAALEDLQRGVAISARTMGGAATVDAAFGIPLMVLAYVLLKFKEVAP